LAVSRPRHAPGAKRQAGNGKPEVLVPFPLIQYPQRNRLKGNAPQRESRAMVRERPTVVMVVAILNIIYGSFGLLCLFCQGAGLGIMAAMSGAGPGPLGMMGGMIPFLEKEAPGYLAFSIGYIVLGLILTVDLILAGIGLLRMRTWARWNSVAVAVLTLL